MTSEIPKLRDILELKYGFPLTSEDRVKGNFPIYGSNGITDYHNESKVKGPGIIVGRKGNPGTINWSDLDFFPIDTTFYVEMKDSSIPIFYTYLALKQMNLPWFAADSAVPGINRNTILNLPFEFNISEKNMQVNMKNAENMNRLIQNTEGIRNLVKDMISTLFRSWFIDFDPVKAKAVGKLPYGMDEETAALFPDSFEDSELGKIPTGWNIGRIGDIADISSGKHQPERSKQKSSEYCTPLLGGAGIISWTTESMFDEPIIVIGRVGTLGVVKKYTSPVWPSDNTLIFKTHHDSSFHYLLHQLKLQDFGAYNRGSTQPLLTQSDMKKLKLLIPNEDILMAFEEKIRSMTLLSDISKDQSEILTKTRDALLPRLMSGELEVSMEA